MSANDYIARVVRANPKLFANKKDVTLNITPENLLGLVRGAFESGEKAGRESKSMLEQIFGR